MMYTISQIMIFVCGVGSIALMSANNKHSKWGPVVGLLGQPFWFYSAITDGAWGIFASAILFTFFFSLGIYNFWLRKENKKGKK